MGIFVKLEYFPTKAVIHYSLKLVDIWESYSKKNTGFPILCYTL